LKGSWPWPWIGSYCIPSCITHRTLPTRQIFIEIKETFCGRTDGHRRSALLRRLQRVDLKNCNNSKRCYYKSHIHALWHYTSQTVQTQLRFGRFCRSNVLHVFTDSNWSVRKHYTRVLLPMQSPYHTFYRPIAIAYSMRQIIKASLPLSVCPSAYTLAVAFLDGFSAKIGTDAKSPQN